MRTTVAVLAALPALVASVWLAEPTENAEPAGPVPSHAHTTPSENTIKRRIQYTSRSKAGLHDRLQIFTFLNNLAHYHGATAHIIGGVHSASLWLDHNHSASIAEDWSFYFDTTANGGNPFHEASLSMPCRKISDLQTNWTRIFDDGDQCLNIKIDYYHYNRTLTGEFLDDLYAPKPSAYVKNAFHYALRGVIGPYGLLHVRRCDRVFRNGICTDPDHVKELVAATSVKTFLVFTYAEVGYLPALQNKLRELQDFRFIYEEETFALMMFADDNYLKYAALLLLEQRADSLLELRKCPAESELEHPLTSNLVKNLPEEPGDDRDAREAALSNRGVCDSRWANGPFTPPEEAKKLKPRHGFEWH